MREISKSKVTASESGLIAKERESLGKESSFG